jgi:hypothetical protein
MLSYMQKAPAAVLPKVREELGRLAETTATTSSVTTPIGDDTASFAEQRFCLIEVLGQANDFASVPLIYPELVTGRNATNRKHAERILRQLAQAWKSRVTGLSALPEAMPAEPKSTAEWTARSEVWKDWWTSNQALVPKG